MNSLLTLFALSVQLYCNIHLSMLNHHTALARASLPSIVNAAVKPELRCKRALKPPGVYQFFWQRLSGHVHCFIFSDWQLPDERRKRSIICEQAEFPCKICIRYFAVSDLRIHFLLKHVMNQYRRVIISFYCGLLLVVPLSILFCLEELVYDLCHHLMSSELQAE